MKRRYKILNSLLLVMVLFVAGVAFTISRTDDCSPPVALDSGTVSMNAISVRCYGSPDVVEYAAVEMPTPNEDEVLVKIVSASVNPLDYHYMRGSPYVMRLASGLGSPDDSRAGVDFAGVVTAVGDRVSEFRPGDEVFGGRNGAFAEYVVVAEDRGITHKPPNVSFDEAAGVPIAAITALQALRDSGGLRPGQKVLINGASGGVGTYAVQIAKAMGAEVSGVCSTRNVEMVKALGADKVIDYKVDDYTQRDERYDLIIDNVGNHSIRANLGVLDDGGSMVLVGGPKGDWIAPLKPPLKALAISPFTDHTITTLLAEINKEDLQALAEMMEAGQLRTAIDRHFLLSQTADAIRYSETGRARGKIIIDVQDDQALTQ